MRLAVAFLSVLLMSSYFLIAQVQDDIVKKHIQAIGGEKNWQLVKTLRSTATRESEGSVIEEKKQLIINKAIRIDYRYRSRDAALGQKDYFVLINENQGWKYLPDNRKDSVEAMTAAEIAWYKNEYFRFDPFLAANKPANKVEFLNKENIAERECFKFMITYADGTKAYTYLDAKLYHLVKTVQIGGEAEAEYDYDDYRLVNRLVTLPFRVSTAYEKLIVQDVQINVALDEKIFRLNAR